MDAVDAEDVAAPDDDDTPEDPPLDAPPTVEDIPEELDDDGPTPVDDALEDDAPDDGRPLAESALDEVPDADAAVPEDCCGPPLLEDVVPGSGPPGWVHPTARTARTNNPHERPMVTSRFPPGFVVASPGWCAA